MEKSILSLFIENSTKYYKIHVLWKCNQNNKSNLWYSTLEFRVLYKVPTFVLALEVCIYECPQTLKILSLG
jgi:hypothetical protein